MAMASEPNFIQSYGDGGFRIGGETYAGSVIVLRDAVHPWSISDFSDITADSFNIVSESGILLVGTGKIMSFLAPDLRAALSARGLTADAMDTGAACRTFNVLLAEDRAVFAALIATN
ncbi:MAG: hypothetical protein HQ514_15175 [Rhodospirillales bacterium]|nr:hypothetical protein [Rhodospirillales bacterium]